MDILHTDNELSVIAITLNTRLMGGEKTLKDCLEEITALRSYDEILLDCGPTPIYKAMIPRTVEISDTLKALKKYFHLPQRRQGCQSP